jgi:GR25 family glycosyltransferase involved in LPS biosynthesis
MEDDFKLGAGFAHAVSVVAAFIEHAGFVRLQADLRARKTAVERCDGYTLARFTKPPHGLMCYCVSPRVARIFVAATAVMDAPVDVFAKRYWQHGQPLYALLPYTVTPSTLSFDTSIPGRIRTTKPPRVAMQRLARKLNWHCRRILYNLRYSWCDPYAASIREAGAFPARRDAKAEPESIAAGP